jgi:hypothetical protein
MKIAVKDLADWQGEARGIWLALRDVHHEWGLSAVDYCHAAVTSLGVGEDEVRYIATQIEPECDSNDFYQIFKDSFADLLAELGYDEEAEND